MIKFKSQFYRLSKKNIEEAKRLASSLKIRLQDIYQRAKEIQIDDARKKLKNNNG